jgi:hypothetical protein
MQAVTIATTTTDFPKVSDYSAPHRLHFSWHILTSMLSTDWHMAMSATMLQLPDFKKTRREVMVAHEMGTQAAWNVDSMHFSVLNTCW